MNLGEQAPLEDEHADGTSTSKQTGTNTVRRIKEIWCARRRALRVHLRGRASVAPDVVEEFDVPTWGSSEMEDGVDMIAREIEEMHLRGQLYKTWQEDRADFQAAHQHRKLNHTSARLPGRRIMRGTRRVKDHGNLV